MQESRLAATLRDEEIRGVVGTLDVVYEYGVIALAVEEGVEQDEGRSDERQVRHRRGEQLCCQEDYADAAGGVERQELLPEVVVFIDVDDVEFVVVPAAHVADALNKTKFGTYIYAIGGNRESARLSGVPIKKVEIAVYTISGALSAFAGLVLCSRMYSGQPSVGDGYELDASAACVLGGVSMSGGVGRISGTVIGVLVIGIISNGLNLMNVSSYWQLILKGLIILCAVIIDMFRNKVKAK